MNSKKGHIVDIIIMVLLLLLLIGLVMESRQRTRQIDRALQQFPTDTIP